MANATTHSVLHAQSIRDHIKRGYVLHMDPDWLLLTYGDLTVGNHPKGFVGPRYALCIGVKDEATFWVMLSSKCRDTGDDTVEKIQVPPEARVGPWSENSTPTFLFHDQIWVMTKEMATAAHIQSNGVRKTFKHNSVVPRCIPNMPEIPIVYPKNFTPIDRTPKPTPVLPVAAASLMHELVAGPVSAPAPREPLAVEPQTPEPLMTQAVADEPEVQAAIDREAHVALAVKLLSNPRLTDAEVVKLVDHLQTSVIDTLLGA